MKEGDARRVIGVAHAKMMGRSPPPSYSSSSLSTTGTSSTTDPSNETEKLEGLILVVRPDGHIGCAVRLHPDPDKASETVDALNQYFGAFIVTDTKTKKKDKDDDDLGGGGKKSARMERL